MARGILADTIDTTVMATTARNLGHNGPNEDAAAHASKPDSVDSYPSRCESPLLPMGQGPSYQIDPDRLSQHLGQAGSRYSQQSIVRKDYAIPYDAGGDERLGLGPSSWHKGSPANSNGSRTRPHMGHPRMTTTRAKSYRIHVPSSQMLPVRDLSSKLKSACRKLNPKRLAKAAHSSHSRGGHMHGISNGSSNSSNSGTDDEEAVTAVSTHRARAANPRSSTPTKLL
ncbi:hypothetical protein GGI25_000432 [Coemansia spiralis]|uniref:Uncharacterized protein n=2 Tax=Coemansia TaxID=4863 RepID=A0A9W8GC11_9FUNG|nr:hypothetical protein BX070DRAFT_250938 [Coemansia spiralis]KAJ1996369.1 hypothetical protein EDC05_000259 [Coemansia umbellata]KAJ2624167.1 hypothetical protein GGI26_001743 [Coemansia sp. RSA 1358]KAJ2680797.1 hypothetical protein GGI25_000432 [Coemansia spiralis]